MVNPIRIHEDMNPRLEIANPSVITHLEICVVDIDGVEYLVVIGKLLKLSGAIEPTMTVFKDNKNIWDLYDEDKSDAVYKEIEAWYARKYPEGY